MLRQHGAPGQSDWRRDYGNWPSQQPGWSDGWTNGGRLVGRSLTTAPSRGKRQKDGAGPVRGVTPRPRKRLATPGSRAPKRFPPVCIKYSPVWATRVPLGLSSPAIPGMAGRVWRSRAWPSPPDRRRRRSEGAIIARRPYANVSRSRDPARSVSQAKPLVLSPGPHRAFDVQAGQRKL